MPRVIFATHPEVTIDPSTPVPQWGLSEQGRARMQAFVQSGNLSWVGRLWTSPERKARESAAIASQVLGLSPCQEKGLAEIDREAVGFVPEPRFGELRERFFAEPEASPDGWERAVDAQRRILAALARVEAEAADGHDGDALVIAHGGVGALALAAKLKEPIALHLDQPRQGCWFAYDLADNRVLSEWVEMPEA